MLIKEILDEIDKRGFFLYHPNLWDDNLTKELNKLLKKKEIQTINSLDIKFINEDYYYVRYDNPRKVTVYVDCGYKFLRPLHWV